MELQKPTPSSFEPKGNDSSQPLGDSPATGVAFEKVTIEQRKTAGGNANTMQGISSDK